MITDAKQRETILADLDSTLLVEAGAGSGKTTSLVGRMCALIGSGKARVQQMVAVTFTRKAATELKGRFHISLETAARDEKAAEVRQRYRQALLDLDLLFAGTIHSFCAHLLRERPVESGIDPGFAEVEEEENTLLRSRCWAEYIDNLHSSDSDLLKILSDLGIDPAGLIGTYETVCLYPDVKVAREKLQRPDFGRERGLLDDYLGQAWKALPSSVPEGDWDGLQSLLLRARRLCRLTDLSEDKNLIALLEALNKSPQVTLKRWNDPDTAKQQKQTHLYFRDNVVASTLEKWQRYCHYFVMELVIPAVRYFDEIRQKNSQMNYQDLLIGAARLLRSNGEVRSYFQKRFTHILVDEFQDTDPVQAEVLLYLTCDDPSETTWRNARIRPGALFIVGDPKQSIYRFRRADIDTYNTVKGIVRLSGGRVVPLTVNFRSVPALCKWINPIFKARFPAEADRFQAGFEPLEPNSNEKEGGIRCISVEKQKNNTQSVVASRDAERIASWIDWALQGNFPIIDSGNEKRPAKPEDFMILLRYRRHISSYAKALEAKGISYEVAGGVGFGESEEVGHLLTLLATIVEPDDRVALVGTLRGPFYGASDDLLYRFVKGGGRFSYLLPEIECSDEEARAVISPILRQLGEFHRWSLTQPPATAISRIMDVVGIIPLAATRDMGETRAGNLVKVLEIARLLSSKGYNSFAEVVSGLRQYYEEIETEGMSVEPGRKNVVRIMNLHKAKGLEAAVVFLADPLKDSGYGPELHIDRLGDEAVGYFLAAKSSGEWKKTIVGIPPRWETMEDLEARYDNAEEQRLLYVATTRAKQLLVVSRYPSSPGKGAWKELEAHMTGVEELETGSAPSNPPCRSVITREQFEDAKAGRDVLLSKITPPSYRYDAVTRIVEEASNPFGNSDGKGKAWGSALHKALEIMIEDGSADVPAVSQAVLEQEGIPASEESAMAEILQKVQSSVLWNRMKKAQVRLAEVPFALKTDETPVRVVAGKIDLAFLEEDGWVIVDFKSDSPDGRLDDLVAYYFRQLEMYREYWEEITGETVKEAGIYFVNIDKWITV